MESGERERSGDQPVKPQRGDRVRVTCGQLAGLVGVVERITPSGTYGLVIEQLAEGVFVMVSEAAIERWPAR
jgi:hypothetical protein